MATEEVLIAVVPYRRHLSSVGDAAGVVIGCPAISVIRYRLSSLRGLTSRVGRGAARRLTTHRLPNGSPTPSLGAPRRHRRAPKWFAPRRSVTDAGFTRLSGRVHSCAAYQAGAIRDA